MIWENLLELLSTIPMMVIVFLPVKDHLRWRRVLCTVLFAVLWLAAGAGICLWNGWSTGYWMLLSMLPLSIGFVQCLPLPVWKSVSLFLAVCGVQSCTMHIAGAVALHLPLDWNLPPAVLDHLLNWLFLAAFAYPATHAARWLLNEVEMPGTWYVFWSAPLTAIVINALLYALPLQENGLVVVYYILVYLVLISFYALFYVLARGLGANMRLMQENQFLQMQTAQYENLRRNMEAARQARHDLRQHLTVIQGCLENEDWDALREYMRSYQQSFSTEILRSYSKNTAVDMVLRHYADKAAQQKITMDVSVQMEAQTVIPESEFCVLLGNLLENAVDGAALSQAKRYIAVSILQVGEAMLSLTVDNPCPQGPLWDKKQQLYSRKHSGYGVGTASVRTIAERYGGDARFQWVDGVFCASVLLNPGGLTGNGEK